MEKKYYVMGEVLPFEEDSTHEFKGHCNICVEDLPPWAFIKGTMRRSRRAVSRTLNGFLNGSEGGTVYLGILDNGTIKGLQLTDHQKCHIRIALGDLMGRYQPKVPKMRYKITFVPVVTPKPQRVRSLDDSGYHSGENSSPEVLTTSFSALQLQSHKIRSHTFCWCDKQAKALIDKGVEVPSYVVEITILPPPPPLQEHLSAPDFQLPPLYQDEEGRVYLRGAASVYSLTHQEVAEMTRRQVREHYERILKTLRKELLDCERALASKHPPPLTSVM